METPTGLGWARDPFANGFRVGPILRPAVASFFWVGLVGPVWLMVSRLTVAKRREWMGMNGGMGLLLIAIVGHSLIPY